MYYVYIKQWFYVKLTKCSKKLSQSIFCKLITVFKTCFKKFIKILFSRNTLFYIELKFKLNNFKYHI